MGHSTWSDVVPFVYHDAFEVSHYGRLEDENENTYKLVDPEAWLEGEDCETDEEAEVRKKSSVEVCSWRFYKEADTSIGKKNSLWGHVWRKGPHQIWLVNESEYSNVGQYNIAAVANKRVDLEKFVEDFGLAGSIEETDSVQQSG